MNISSMFIRRPVMTTLMVLALLLAGVQGYRMLPVSDLPNVDFPTITVTASLPGASPETMASAVATPLERVFSTIQGVDSMNSTSVYGSTQVTLQFALERDIDAAAQDVQSMIMQANRDMPKDMTSPPSYRKVNPADSPILYIALRSSILPLSEVNEYADTMMAQRISMVSGVAQVQVFGSQKYAVRVQLDPQAMATRKVGIDEVSAAVQNANVNLPAGDLQGADRAFTVQAEGQIFRADGYGPLIVSYRNGAPVRLNDLGKVFDSVENDKVASWLRDTRAIVLAVQRQPGTNTIEVVERVRKLLPSFQQQLPKSLEMEVLFDRSLSIQESVNDVKFTLLLTTGLVVMVIFLFLRNVRATVIPALALISSIVGTFAVMYAFGFNIDNLSLMALTLATGFVVDDAIVMLENVIRHMEKGEKPMEASFRGSREIGFTIVSMTVSLVAVFIPVLFMPGIMGRIFREFAITISAAILISGIISLTQTPMLCSRFLRPPDEGRHGPLYRVLEWGFDSMLWVYRWTLWGVMRARPVAMLVFVALIVLTGYLFTIVPKGFIPSEDTGQIRVSTEATQGVSFKDMSAHQQALAAVVNQDPNVQAFMSAVGGGGTASTSNAGRMFIVLKPRDERIGVEQFIAKMRPMLAKVPGIKAYLQNPPPISLGGQMTKGQYQYTLQATSLDDLYNFAPILEKTLKEAKFENGKGLLDVNSDLLLKNPEANIEVDRDKAAALGLTVRQVEEALYTAYGSRQISTIYAPTNQYRVVMELLPEYKSDPSSLGLLYLRSATGKLVPLETVTRVRKEVGPMTVAHLGQLPSVTISFNLPPEVSLGAATDFVAKVARETLPSTITGSFQGTAQAFQKSMGGTMFLLLAALIVVYIVLGILYESYIHPITILSGLPAAGVGALLTLLLFGSELNLYSLVGLVMLIGIVKKNAIMMVDFALVKQREEGLKPFDAMYEAALVRFRPIMMTTMAALMGTLPIALGMGAGSESRRPLGLAVVGGLIVSQMLTLYITPVFYTYMEALAGLFKGKKQQAALPPEEEAEASWA
jgi:HAE1 family hydrophobic/amphiphilic exporter-1